MARDFSRALYKSGAWIKNSKNYARMFVDVSGHVLRTSFEDGILKYSYVDEDGRTHYVPDSLVVPPAMCERCFQMGELRPYKVVHHKVWLTPENVNDPKIALSYSNMQRLCQDCHAIVHSNQMESRAVFDDKGNVVGARGDDSFEMQVMRLTEGNHV